MKIVEMVLLGALMKTTIAQPGERRLGAATSLALQLRTQNPDIPTSDWKLLHACMEYIGFERDIVIRTATQRRSREITTKKPRQDNWTHICSNKESTTANRSRGTGSNVNATDPMRPHCFFSLTPSISGPILNVNSAIKKTGTSS